jgi:hypothetical protein
MPSIHQNFEESLFLGHRLQRVFQEVNDYLGNPPLLSQPVEGEALYLYLAVFPSAVSSTLIHEEQGV